MWHISHLLVVNRRRQCRVFFIAAGYNFVSCVKVRISVPGCWMRDVWIEKIDGFHLFGDPLPLCSKQNSVHIFSFESYWALPFSIEFATSGCASHLCSGRTRSNLEGVNDDPNYVSSFFISVCRNTEYLKDFFHSCFSSLIITNPSFRRCWTLH